MGNTLMRFLLALLAVAVLLMLSSQIYNTVNVQYVTEQAVIYSSADRVSFRGVYIRDEAVIRKSYSGVLSFPIEDGSKVGNGSVVAYIYRSEADIETNRKIKDIEAEIELLRAAQNPGTVLTVHPENISKLIAEKYQSMSTILSKRDISELKDCRDDMLTLMSIYQIAVNQEENYDGRISELTASLDSLRAKQQGYISTVTSPDSGYFVSFTDGYENRLNTSDNSAVTADLIKEVTSGKNRGSRSKSEIGKLVKGYDWKIAGIIDNSDSVYNPGDEVKVKFASTPDTVTAVIESLEPTDDPKEWVLILRCDQMTFDLVRKRTERVEMTLNDFEGIRIPREALRFNGNNEKGCYVLWGQRVLFKKVDPVFEDEDYLLSRITSDETFVCVHDDIIIDGVDTAAYKANSEETVDKGEEEDKIPVYSQTEATRGVISEDIADLPETEAEVTTSTDDPEVIPKSGRS